MKYTPTLMKNLTLTLITALFSLVFMSGCLSDDVEDIVDIVDIIDELEGTPGSIVAEINGEAFGASGSFVTADLNEGQNGSFNLIIGGVRLQDGISSGIALGITSSDFSSVSVGSTFVGSDSERLFVGGYSVEEVEDNEDIVNSGSELLASNTATITKIDRTNNLISGTFSFNAVDRDTELVYEIRNGVFTDLEYD